MNTHNILEIDITSLKKRMDADSSLCLIDVREDHEWNKSHIASAIHIPKDQVSANISLYAPQLNTPIYLYCHAGTRSLYAAKCLQELGYSDLYSVAGGLAAWEKAGYNLL